MEVRNAKRSLSNCFVALPCLGTPATLLLKETTTHDHSAVAGSSTPGIGGERSVHCKYRLLHKAGSSFKFYYTPNILFCQGRNEYSKKKKTPLGESGAS